MKTSLNILLFILLSSTPLYAQITNMNLSGQGVARYLGFIKVYNASLYSSKDSSVDNILSPDTSKCLELTYEVSLSTSNFIEGAETVLQRQYSSEELEQISPLLEKFHNAYLDVDKGDTYSLCYQAATQTTRLKLNGNELVDIQSPDFARMYFGIWIGPKNPLDTTLRDSLLANLPAQGVN